MKTKTIEIQKTTVEEILKSLDKYEANFKVFEPNDNEYLLTPLSDVLMLVYHIRNLIKEKK